MFRKLVSNLAFSPALVGQIGFYSQRLRKEEATRRIGLIFTALALIVQSFAVFSPPEAANAANRSNFIDGGITTKEQLLRHYDQNTNNIKDLFTVIGITRSNLASTSSGTVNSKTVYSWGLMPHFSAAQGERSYTVKTSNGGLRTYHYRSLHLWDAKSNKNGTNQAAFVGKTKDGMYFAIMKACGNLLLKTAPPAPKCPTGQVGTYPKCSVPPKMCVYPGKTDLLASDKNCKPEPKCTIVGKTGLDSSDPKCKPDPAAACSTLKVIKMNDRYQLDGTSAAANGATISSYTYVVKKDGKVIDTITQTANNKLTNTAITKQSSQGVYTVELTVKTSIGNKTSDNCAKTFIIPAPKMCPVNPAILESSPECQPCEGDTTIWIKDDKCSAELINTKTASNLTQGGINATTTTAKAGDKITYTLNMKNNGKSTTEVVPTENLADILEYADIIDAGGGSFDKDSAVLTWPSLSLKPGESQARMFAIQIRSEIPAMGIGTSDRTSYDCRIDNTFGNTVSISIDCPVQKQFVEQTVSELPHTGPRENMIFAGTVFAIVAYFYTRSRQIGKEVRLIRRELNAGTI